MSNDEDPNLNEIQSKCPQKEILKQYYHISDPQSKSCIINFQENAEKFYNVVGRVQHLGVLNLRVQHL